MIYKKICPICKNEFEALSHNAQYCKDCKLKGSAYKTTRPRTNTPRKHIGASTEMAVCIDLLNRGYDVFRSVSDHGYFDIVAYGHNGIILKVEATTGAIYKSGIRSYDSHQKYQGHFNLVAVHYADKICYYTVEGKEVSIDMNPTIFSVCSFAVC